MSTSFGTRPTTNTLRWNVAMKWVRRLHLYAGLLLFPWIILYGLTACLFNHPDLFSDRAPSQKHQLEGMPTAPSIVDELVKKMNGGSSQSEIKVRAINKDEAFFSRKLVASVPADDGQNVQVVVDLASGEAEIRQRGTKTPAGNVPAFAKEKMKLSIDPFEGIKDQVTKMLKEQGKDAKELQWQAMPDLEFVVEVDGEVWEMKYNMQRGSFTGRKSDTPSNLTVRNFLLRLHLSHGYPNETNTKFCWAIVVDVMFVAMVFWGLSGLFMWWQLKAQRRIGFVLLVISAGLATWLTVGMHSLFSK